MQIITNRTPATVPALRGLPHRFTHNRITVGSLTIEPRSREVTVNGRPISLTRKEYALLRALASEPTRVFTREELLVHVWGYAAESSTRALDATAFRLRNKLRVTGHPYVENVWGVGYRLGLPEELPEMPAAVGRQQQLAQDLLSLFSNGRPAHPAILEHAATQLARAVLEEDPPPEVFVVHRSDDAPDWPGTIAGVHGTRGSARRHAQCGFYEVERRVLDDIGEYLPAVDTNDRDADQRREETA